MSPFTVLLLGVPGGGLPALADSAGEMVDGAGAGAPRRPGSGCGSSRAPASAAPGADRHGGPAGRAAGAAVGLKPAARGRLPRHCRRRGDGGQHHAQECLGLRRVRCQREHRRRPFMLPVPGAGTARCAPIRPRLRGSPHGRRPRSRDRNGHTCARCRRRSGRRWRSVAVLPASGRQVSRPLSAARSWPSPAAAGGWARPGAGRRPRCAGGWRSRCLSIWAARRWRSPDSLALARACPSAGLCLSATVPPLRVVPLIAGVVAYGAASGRLCA